MFDLVPLPLQIVGVAAVKLIWMSEVLSDPSSLVAGDL